MVTKIESLPNGIDKFLCDTSTDVANLPKANTGSIAIIADTADVYIRISSKQWVKFGGGSNGS